MAKSPGEIADLLQHTKFKRKRFGGVDEEDVWEKIGRLQAEYSELIEENSRKHDALVGQWQEYAVSLKKQLQEQGSLQQPLPASQEVHAEPPIDGKVISLMRRRGL